MKHTIFQFGLRLEGDEPVELMKSITERLKAMKGVDGVEVDLRQASMKLRVHASFTDADAAKKLHRKIMTALIKMDGVKITQATSNITDVFG
jgi:hypothetical protein